MLGHKVDAGVQQPVQRAGDRQKNADHTAEDDDRDEVGHIQHQLDLLFDFFALDAVEQESQNDGDGEAPQQAVDAQLKGVDKVALEIRRGHEALEVFETDPLAAQDALEGVVILESDQDAAHRHVLENQGQRHSRQNEDQIQLPVPRHIDARIVHTLAGRDCYRPGSGCFHVDSSFFYTMSLSILHLHYHRRLNPLRLVQM